MKEEAEEGPAKEVNMRREKSLANIGKLNQINLNFLRKVAFLFPKKDTVDQI